MLGLKKKKLKIPEPKFNIQDLVIYEGRGIRPPVPPRSFLIIDRKFGRKVYSTFGSSSDQKWLYTGYVLEPAKTNNPKYTHLTVIHYADVLEEDELSPMPDLEELIGKNSNH